MGRHFIKSIVIITLLYIVWLLIFHFSAEQMDRDAAPAQSNRLPLRPSEEIIAYEDLAAAYEQLQQQLQKADSTHLIRRYHGRHALFSAERIFDERTMALSRSHFESQLGRERLFLDLPAFHWRRDDEARPVDVMRLTFRGNGIPDNVEELARSGLLEPKLHAFYSALIQQNTVLWTLDDASIDFTAVTRQGKLYHARSTPFIAVQRLSKDYFAKMKAASLPFLWAAYVDEDEERVRQQALLAEPHGPPDLIGPRLPFGYAPPKRQHAPDPLGPFLPRSKAEIMQSHSERLASPEPHGPFLRARPGNVLDALPDLAGTMMQQQSREPKRRSVQSFHLDERKVEALFEESLVDESHSLSETLQWKKAINRKRLDDDPAAPARHLDRLARLDPEFMTLFLINNLFDQYNIFSVFEEDVFLTINAVDTRMNVLYTSYNLRFDPPENLPESEQAGCNGTPVHISDEFFLIAAQPHSYLIRIYLPACRLDRGEYALVDRFINQLRILH